MGFNVTTDLTLNDTERSHTVCVVEDQTKELRCEPEIWDTFGLEAFRVILRSFGALSIFVIWA